MQSSNQTVLIIGFVWPEPTTTAAGTRMLQLIKCFQKCNYQVVFVSTAGKSEYSFNLSKIGVLEKEIQLNNSSFDDYLVKLNPSIVIFDRFIIEEQFGWRVTENVPNAVKILDTEDLHSLRKTREFALKKKIDFTIDLWKSQDITKREVASIFRCDLSLIISSYELDLLAKELNVDNKLLLLLPFMLPKVEEKLPSFDNRKDFVCIGNGKHTPNVNAIIRLKKLIWTKIREQLPNAQLHIYGAYLPEQILQMHNAKQGFIVHGWAKSASAVLKDARICLAPMIFGAGIKGKLITAMQSGTPSITTTVGAEGILFKNEWSGVITNNVDDFISNAVNMYQDKNCWDKAQTTGRDIINEFYNEKKLSSIFIKRIKTIQNNLDNYRSKNFIGSMLQHQNMQSTKYMSKWIELKNKK